jgi:RNA polymerase sigma-70 factor (ECF subfamily)
MNSANLRCLSVALGLKRLSQKGRSQLRAHLSKRKESSPTAHTLGNAKPDPLDASHGNEAIRSAQQGDARAFETIYHEHSGRVYALCLRMLRDPTEAQDLTQDVFLQLFRKIHTFRGESAFSTWLHRLAVNLVLMRLRRKSPLMVSFDATTDPNDETSPLTIDISARDLLLEGSIDRVALNRCLEQLPAGYRAIFVLHDIQGYQHHEIAEMVGRSAANSKSQLHKARKRLRELLHEVQREKARDKRLAACKLDSHSSLVPHHCRHRLTWIESRK